jgi:hypothetical protein
MSKPEGVAVRPIPTGLLVSAADKTRKEEKAARPIHADNPLSISNHVRHAERPSPRRKVLPRVREIPWLWIAAGGSVAWVLILLAIGLCTPSSERPTALARPQAITVAPPMLAPPAPEPIIEPVVEWEAPPAQAPELRFREAAHVQADDMHIPPIIVPEEGNPANPPSPKRDPGPARKNVDLTRFASCAQIGADVLFLKEPLAAFQQAHAEKKLVFMVHLAGNLEDKDFT